MKDILTFVMYYVIGARVLATNKMENVCYYEACILKGSKNK